MENKFNWRVIFLCILVIVFVGIGSYNGYQRGYNQGLKELEDYKSNNHVYYDGWKLLNSTLFSPNHYAEHLSYENSSYDIGKINNYYSLRFNNYNADEGFEVTIDLNHSSCVLHTINNKCFRDFNESAENPYPTNCDKDYVIGNKPRWMEQ